jgi:hypothetical protein
VQCYVVWSWFFLLHNHQLSILFYCHWASWGRQDHPWLFCFTAALTAIKSKNIGILHSTEFYSVLWHSVWNPRKNYHVDSELCCTAGSHMQKWFNLLINDPSVTDWWNNRELKISWNCPLKASLNGEHEMQFPDCLETSWMTTYQSRGSFFLSENQIHINRV